MHRLLNLLRAVKTHWAGRQTKGLAAQSPWFNVAIFAAFGALVTWLGEPTLMAWREVDRILATHPVDATGLAVLVFLTILSGALLASFIIASAAFKAVIDRLQ